MPNDEGSLTAPAPARKPAELTHLSTDEEVADLILYGKQPESKKACGIWRNRYPADHAFDGADPKLLKKQKTAHITAYPR